MAPRPSSRTPSRSGTPALADPVTTNQKHLKSDSNSSSTTSIVDSEIPNHRISFTSGRVFRPDPTKEEIESKTPEELRAQYPPDDARAMSPRRSSAETDQIHRNARIQLQRHAQSLQSSLDDIANQIENVKADHARLERDNLELQNYIGGLTRSISSTSMTSGKNKK